MAGKGLYSFESSDHGLNTGVCVEKREEKLPYAVTVFFLTYPQHSPYSRFESRSFLSPSPWHNKERG